MPEPTLTLDIATRFLGAAEDIYIIRPGEKFSLYDDFIRKSAIFLDFPDIGLDFSGPKPKRDALRQAVVRSMALSEWHRKGGHGQPPSRAAADYAGLAKGRRIGRYVGAIQRLYFELPTGTIIVVPGPGYFSDVLIGELIGPSTEVRDVSLYPGEALPARRIRWIGRRPKAQFSERLRDRLQKPVPLMAVERSLRGEILEAAFDQYSIGNRYSARFKTTLADFSTLDDYNIQTFINYVSGVLVAVDGGDGVGKIDLPSALALLASRRDLIPEMTSNINSPGALRLFSERVAPLVVAVVFAIAVATPAGSKPENVQVTNSAVAGDDPCALVVQQQAMTAIKLMDLDTWHKVCVQARDASSSTGLSTTITVVKDTSEP